MQRRIRETEKGECRQASSMRTPWNTPSPRFGPPEPCLHKSIPAQRCNFHLISSPPIRPVRKRIIAPDEARIHTDKMHFLSVQIRASSVAKFLSANSRGFAEWITHPHRHPSPPHSFSVYFAALRSSCLSAHGSISTFFIFSVSSLLRFFATVFAPPSPYARRLGTEQPVELPMI